MTPRFPDCEQQRDSKWRRRTDEYECPLPPGDGTDTGKREIRHSVSQFDCSAADHYSASPATGAAERQKGEGQGPMTGCKKIGQQRYDGGGVPGPPDGDPDLQ